MYMKVDKGNNIYFGSRRPVIRKADDMVRRINQMFPMASSTKYLNKKNYYDHFPYRNRRDNITYIKLDSLRKNCEFNLVLERYGSKSSVFKKCSDLIDQIKNLKVGNCGECSFLAKVFAECNGLKNIYRADLYCGDEDIDHSVLFIDDKKPYIIDPWLGFADYVPKAFERYVGEYFNFIFDEEEDDVEQYLLNFKKNAISVYNFSHGKFSKGLITKLTNKYPELLLKGDK